MLLLPALAHAALRDDLRTALANGPTAAVVCSSGTEAMQRLASSLELLGDEVGDTTPFTTLFNVNTAVGLTYWEANKTVEMRFAMADEAAARQWVSTVGERLGKDPRAYDVHWKDGWGAIQSGEIPTSNPAASTDLLAHLSDAPGCLLYMNVPTEKAGQVEMALHLPFEKGAPAAWAIALGPLQGKKQPVPMVEIGRAHV